MQHVFISYVRENKDVIDRLCMALNEAKIRVWLDRNDIVPGAFWKDAVRNAISNGAFFIACFSEEYSSRDCTYMNEELTLAIEQLRQRQPHRAWFIPLLLSGEIPDREIGAAKTLRDLQWVELNNGTWNDAIRRILRVIQPVNLEKSETKLQLLIQVAVLEFKSGKVVHLGLEDIEELWANKDQFTFDEDAIRVILQTLHDRQQPAFGWIREFPGLSIRTIHELLNSRDRKNYQWICKNIDAADIAELALPIWKKLGQIPNLPIPAAEKTASVLLHFGEAQIAVQVFRRLMFSKSCRHMDVRSFAKRFVGCGEKIQAALMEIAEISSVDRAYRRDIAESLLNTSLSPDAQILIKVIYQEEKIEEYRAAKERISDLAHSLIKLDKEISDFAYDVGYPPDSDPEYDERGRFDTLKSEYYRLIALFSSIYKEVYDPLSSEHCYRFRDDTISTTEHDD